MPVDRGQADAGVDHEEDGVGLGDGGLGLDAHAPGEARRLALLEARRVDDREAEIAELGVALAAVARDAGLVVDQRQLLADEPVEQRRLADVWPADHGDGEGRHFAGVSDGAAGSGAGVAGAITGGTAGGVDSGGRGLRCCGGRRHGRRGGRRRRVGRRLRLRRGGDGRHGRNLRQARRRRRRFVGAMDEALERRDALAKLPAGGRVGVDGVERAAGIGRLIRLQGGEREQFARRVARWAVSVGQRLQTVLDVGITGGVQQQHGGPELSDVLEGGIDGGVGGECVEEGRTCRLVFVARGPGRRKRASSL